MRQHLLTFIALSTLLAGCVDGLDGATLSPASVALTPTITIASAGQQAQDAASVVWEGKTLRAEGTGGVGPAWLSSPTPAKCGETNCERVPFTLAIPEGFWDGHEGGVEVSVQVDQDAWAGITLEVFDASGTRVAVGKWAQYATTAILPTPASGAYEAVVLARSGEGPYVGVVQVEARPRGENPTEDLLPNLVTLPPQDIAIAYVIEGVAPDPILGLAGVRGCDPWEIVEQGARRCLRFSNSVGNAGTGALEVRLTFQEGAAALAGDGQFVQRLYRLDGSYVETPVANAVFHPTHAHFHYSDLAAYSLHAYDMETGRGDLVREGRKAGFCFFDMGLVNLTHVGTTPPHYNSGSNCFLTPGREWVTGLSPGWFDEYGSHLSEQYVDISGLEDGTYELVSIANGARTLIESDYTDNEASVVFRLSGNDVEVVPR